MLPKEWKECQLKDVIASLEAGVSVNGEGRPADLNEKGVLKVSSVSYGIFKPQENKAIIEDDVSRARLNPKKDKIIFSRANTPELVGASAYIYQDYPNLYLSDKLWQIEPRSDNISMRWLSFLLGSPTMRKKIADSASGSSKSMQNISKADFLEIEISLPPLPEQKKIAEILGAWDTAIEQLETLIEKKQLLKRGLMQKLLTGKMRFREFEEKDWSEGPLGDFVEKIVGGGTPRREISEYWSNNEIPWITVKDMKSKIIHRTQEYISKLGLAKSATSLITANTLIVSTRMAVGRIVFCDRDAAINQDLKAIFTKNILNPHFLGFYFEYYGNIISGMANGSTVKGIGLDQLKALRICIPSLIEQCRIVEILQLSEYELHILRKQIETLKTQKLGLQLELLSGRLRVNTDNP